MPLGWQGGALAPTLEGRNHSDALAGAPVLARPEKGGAWPAAKTGRRVAEYRAAKEGRGAAPQEAT